MTITVELLQEDALPLLQNLERLHILKFVLPTKTKPAPKPSSKAKKSRFAGRISKKTAEILHQQLAQMRDEWQ